VGGKDAQTYRQIIANFEAGARAAGRDPATMPRIIEERVAFTADIQGAVASLKRYWASSFLPAMFNYRIYDPATAQRNGEVVGEDFIRRTVLISPDPAEHIRHAEELLDIGFDRIYFFSAGPDQRAFIEGYGQEVLPKLRQRYGGMGQRRAA
jgi:coenzyme F420-dependent glucose-6-phosphate dehydrogenase